MPDRPIHLFPAKPIPANPSAEQLQSQIEQLREVVSEQGNAIMRLHAATLCHACPAGQTHDSEPANIEECIRDGNCSCEVGFILTATKWPPP